MTIIAAALAPDGRAAIAADGYTENGHIRHAVPSKLHRWGPWVVAFCGPALWRRFLDQEAWALSDYTPEAFADAWVEWAAHRRHGSQHDGHWSIDGAWLLVRHGEIVEVDGDGAVVRQPASLRYMAIGSGSAVAMGALHALSACAPGTAVERAVHAAIAHAHGCGGPVEVVVCEPPPESP